jgi:ketosteroid isomerase-like protein
MSLMEVSMHKKTVLLFIDSINAHDVDGIVGFLADDHVFIDAQDNEYKGKQRMGESWAEYFVLFPDYTITVEDVLEQENTVAVFGYASATYKGPRNPENFWRLPTAWKGIVEKDKIKVWQVYADYALILDIIEKNK